MRVAFLTGPVPAGFCGVGDYTRLLAGALERQGVHVAVLESPGPPVLLAFRLRAATKKFQPDIIHIQYPTAGFGKGLTPQVFSLMTRFVLTLHEVEGRHLLRRLSLYPLWFRARHVIFTCESNMAYSLRRVPWLRHMSTVIPLSSNIPVMVNRRSGQAIQEVIHFGLVRPDKGIESVLEYAKLVSSEQMPVSVRIVGNSPSVHASYLAYVRSTSTALPVTWDLNLSAEDVAKRLAQAMIAYMPFPDGVSERHASILAALANGLPVITTKGKFTPRELECAVKFCATPREAVAATRELLDKPALREALGASACQYAARFSWESIAESHIKIYERIIAAGGACH